MNSVLLSFTTENSSFIESFQGITFYASSVIELHAIVFFTAIFEFDNSIFNNLNDFQIL